MNIVAAEFPFGPVFTAVATVLGLAGLAGAAIAWGRVQLAKTTLDLYKADNEALRSRIDTLEGEKVELQHGVAEASGKIATLESANKVLADQVTGASAVAKLGETIGSQHRQVVDMIRLLGVELTKRGGDTRGDDGG